MVYAALGQLGFSTFRSGQEEAIMRILSGNATKTKFPFDNCET